MPETEANEANFAEIRGHLDIIKAKLAKPTDGTTRASLVEDQEDYYERMLQLRIMQNRTQGEELKESLANVKIVTTAARRTRIKLGAITVVAIVMAVELGAPGTWWHLLASSMIWAILSHCLTAVAVLAIAAIMWK